MNVIELLQGQLDDNMIKQLTRHIGASSTSQTEMAASGVISTLVAGLNKNAAQPDGANMLISALDRDHDGSVMDDVAGFLLGGRQTSNTSALNGAGILNHILGNKQESANQVLGQASGLDSGQITKLMIALAPMVLAALGKARKEKAIDAGNIGDLLSGSVRSQVNQKQEMGILERLLDQDGDGSVMDDIANIGMKFFMNRK